MVLSIYFSLYVFGPDFFVVFFFLCGSIHHRVLHSFPTRRSSDLEFEARHVVETGTQLVERSSAIAAAVAAGDLAVVGATRSEEHTSELQSRENLVCRLLLEKKKLKTAVNKTHCK